MFNYLHGQLGGYKLHNEQIPWQKKEEKQNKTIFMAINFFFLIMFQS